MIADAAAGARCDAVSLGSDLVSETEADAQLLDRLAEEFLERLRRGDRPMVSEYTTRHPGLAQDIRQLLAALALVDRKSTRLNSSH